MRILVLAPPMGDFGGIQRYIATLVQAFQEIAGEGAVHCEAMSEVTNVKGRGRLTARSKLSFCFRALREAVRGRADLIICAHLALGPIGWLASGITRRPYWVVVFGIEAWIELPWLKRMALRHADKVLSISEFTSEQVMKRHGLKREHMARLPCALDERLTNIEPASVGPHQLPTDDCGMVLTVARLSSSEQYKGHDVILRALPEVLLRVGHLVYVVAGDGDDRPRLESLADRLGIRQNVIFTGQVSDSELAALYRRCDIFALPARTQIGRHEAKGEGFGIVFIEAMAFGKPVVGPDGGAPKEILHHGRHGFLVNPEDSSAVASALIDLLNHPDKARAMGLAGKEWVRQQYSFTAFRERLRGILDDSFRPCTTAH